MALLVAWLALSQVAEPTPPPDSSRFRFGIGLVSGAVIVPDTSHGLVPLAAALGLDLRLGAQLNDRFALMYDGSLGFAWPQFTGAVLVEWTPVSCFSAATGAEVNAIATYGNVETSTNGFAWGIGVPLRFAFNVPLADEKAPRRRTAIAFSVTATPGYAFATSDYGTGFQLGLMGGISFEMY